MATNEALRDLIRDRLRLQLGTLDEVVEKPMFGGRAFIWRGNLLCGVMADDMLVRIAKADYDDFIRDDGAHAMVMGGQTGRSWILVPAAVVEREPEMRKWLGRAIAFVGTLKAK
jgi:TfoX/Sxy family transcriptional regulator of competence genes